MEDKQKSVYGLYQTSAQAERAVETIVTSGGFTHADVSVLIQDRQSTRDLAHEKHTKAPEGTAVGATTGGTIGGALGLLAGIGAIAIPGVGPFIAAGPIMATLAGAGVGGAVGTLTGALIGMGIPEYEAKRYESFLHKGGSLLSVHADDRAWADRARKILDSCGAKGIDKASEASAKKVG